MKKWTRFTRISKGSVPLSISQHEFHVFQENILVSDSNPPSAIICDFGASRIFNASLQLGQPSSSRKGTTRWLAFEIITGMPCQSNYSKEADVWAFGMTVYVSQSLFSKTGRAIYHITKELMKRKDPYYEHWLEVNAESAIRNSVLPPLEDEGETKHPKDALLKEICKQCWNFEPIDRATMREVLGMLCPEECSGSQSESTSGSLSRTQGRSYQVQHNNPDSDCLSAIRLNYTERTYWSRAWARCVTASLWLQKLKSLSPFRLSQSAAYDFRLKENTWPLHATIPPTSILAVLENFTGLSALSLYQPKF